MKIKLSEHIRLFRRERSMTQEQLAEALGVTVGAVSKWESGSSTPELPLIVEMADLFEISVDVLLGYEWRGGSMAELLERITALQREKDYEEAAAEAEKALKKFPNCFELVYQCALMYVEKGEAGREKKTYRRALSLFNHACGLVAQNTDEHISETSIRTQMAKVHLALGNTNEALALLKKYNTCGINNAMIGMVLGDFLHDAAEAEKYLGRAFVQSYENMEFIMVGYTNVFFQRKDYRAALDCVQWLRNMLRGVQPQNELTYADKYDCVLLETCAEIYCFLNEQEMAKKYLREAIEKAVQYDRAAVESRGVKLFETMNIEHQPTYESFGKTAMECLERRMQPEDEAVPGLWNMWKELTEELGSGS